MAGSKHPSVLTLKLKPHPELQDGEVFYGNSDKKTFDLCRFSTKRRGEVAYDDGKLIEDRPELRPIFVQRSELEEMGFNFEE